MDDRDLEAVGRAGGHPAPVSDDALRRGRAQLLARIDREDAGDRLPEHSGWTRRRALGVGLAASAVAAAVVGATLVGAPHGTRAPGPAGSGAPVSAVPFDVEAARSVFVHGTIDYDPYADTAAMAAASDAVVLGTVLGVRAARVPPPGGTAGERVDTVVVEVRVDREVGGSARRQVDGRILVEIQPPRATLDEQRAALPAGTRMVAYLTAPEGSRDVVADAQAAYRPVGIQAVTVQGADGGPLVRPLLGQVEDADLDDALPGGDAVGY